MNDERDARSELDNGTARRAPERRSAWDGPDNMRSNRIKDKKNPSSGASQSGKNIKTVLLVMLLVLCMLTNTVYAGARAFIGQMNIVQKTDDIVSNTTLANQMKDELGEDEFDTSNLVISDKDVEIFLLVGADFNTEEKGARSDTLMMIALDRIHQKIKVISIMRDLYAPISGAGGSNKINFAYYYDSALGNDDLRYTRATLEKCFGVIIDHFIVVDFDMFIDFINHLPPDGQIEVEMRADEAYYMAHYRRWHQAKNLNSTEAGVYSLDGRESLYYVRMRKTGNGDYERTDRQRRFFGLMLEKAKQMKFTQMVKSLSVVLPYITTDLSENEIFGYCFDAPKLLKYEMVQLRLPIDGAHRMGWATIGSTNVSVLLTNYTFLSETLQNFIYNDDMTYANNEVKASGVALPAVSTVSFTTTTTAKTEETDAAEPNEGTEPSPDTQPTPQPAPQPSEGTTTSAAPTTAAPDTENP